MPTNFLYVLLCMASLSLGSVPVLASQFSEGQQTSPTDHSDKAPGICQSLLSQPDMTESDLAKTIDAVLKHRRDEQRGALSFRQLDFSLPGEHLLRLDIATTNVRGFISLRVQHFFKGRAQSFFQFDGGCRQLGHRHITYNKDGEAERLEIRPAGEVYVFNPPIPKANPTGESLIRVAHIDSGVDYTNPKLASFLAYGPEGTLIGYDFWDDDPFPFDADTSASPFFPRQHGSFVLDILAGTGAPVAVIPYRYPRPDMSRFGEIVRIAAENNARIVMIPMGSTDKQDWVSFSQSALEHSDILFVFSAGNNGFSLDDTPIYPAAFTAPHFVTITSVLSNGNLSEGSNSGGMVDFGVEGDNLPLTYISSPRPTVSGTSFALPRMVGLFACLMAEDRTATPAQTIERAKYLASPSSAPDQYGNFIPGNRIAEACRQFSRTAAPE